jgi:predicted AAA+ superfamily ATPase
MEKTTKNTKKEVKEMKENATIKDENKTIMPTAENTAEKPAENATAENATATAANEIIDPVATTLAEIEVKLNLKLTDGQLREIINIYSANDAEYKKALKNKPSMMQAAVAYLKDESKKDAVIASIGMNCKELVEGLKANNLYIFGPGATPDQTLYTALMRDYKENSASIVEHSKIKGYWKIKAEYLKD